MHVKAKLQYKTIYWTTRTESMEVINNVRVYVKRISSYNINNT